MDRTGQGQVEKPFLQYIGRKHFRDTSTTHTCIIVSLGIHLEATKLYPSDYDMET